MSDAQDHAPPTGADQPGVPDLLIDFASFDDEAMADLFANDCEQLPAKSTLSTARIAGLVWAIIEQHNHFALVHLLAALVADSSANRRQQMTREALRCLLLMLKDK
jgi:hypothetical protein